MHRDARQSPARVLAPLALVLCAIAFLVVIMASGSGEGDGDGSSRQTTVKRERTTTTTRPARRTYIVKQGDTLGGIAAKTGVDGGNPPGAQPRPRPAGSRGRPEDQAARVTAPRLVVCLLVLLALSLPATASAAAPTVDRADAAIVVDASDGAVMLQKSPDERRAIASATKLMTALLTLERARPDDVFTAPAYNASPAESKINLRAGERMRVEDLLEGLLLESANDAAVTLAEAISGSRGAFVSDMNTRASELGLGGDELRQPDRPGRPAELLHRARSRRAGVAAAAPPPLRPDRGHAAGGAANRGRAGGWWPTATSWSAATASSTASRPGTPCDAGYVLVGAAHGPGGADVVSVVLGEPSEAARDADTLALLRWGLSRSGGPRSSIPTRCWRGPTSKYRDSRAALVPRTRRCGSRCAAGSASAGGSRRRTRWRVPSTGRARGTGDRARGRQAGRARGARYGRRGSRRRPAAGDLLVCRRTLHVVAPALRGSRRRANGSALPGETARRSTNDHHRHAQRRDRRDARRARTSGSAAATAPSSRRRWRAARA